MVSKFHDELDGLKADVHRYGEFATGMLKDSVTALRENDLALAAGVIAKKAELLSRCETIEEATLRLVVLYQPMAGDLRAITCITRMNYSCYRIGRVGKNIAKIARFLADAPELPNSKSIFHMADGVIWMLDDVMQAYAIGDVALISSMSERDDMVDDMRTAIFREHLTYMMEDPKNIPRCIDYITVSRHLERCGDHACLMAEKIHFMVTGERIEVR
jgi:phosphate transport system protein